MGQRHFVPPQLERTLAARDAARAKHLATIPGWYRPWAHLGATTSIGLFVLVLALTHIHHLRPAELLIVPVIGLLANFFEWRLHKYALHRRRWPLKLLYDRHTPEHHAIYMEEDMEIRSTREFRLVLIPAFGVAGIVLLTAPFAFVAAIFFGANAGWLVLTTAATIMVSYELLHLSYHVPKSSFLGRRWLIRVLRRHHARHHDPRLMQKWNFNVTIPISDWVFGTTYKPERAQAVDEPAKMASSEAR
jgi:hypothetical protein